MNDDPAPAGFTGHIARVPGVSPGYRVAMCAVAAMLILLPLAYLAIIAAAGWGVALHAVRGVVIIGRAHDLLSLALYLGPLLAGAALIAVMIAPLFSAPQRAPEPLFVSKEQEPVLHALVARVCREVRAPLPRAIAVTCEVNASARFERGPLALLRGRLRLTIGMPLARGLTLEQLTGVLAHEFGHFAQGGGMRLSSVIRSINAWFARVICERSPLERRIAGMGSRGGAAAPAALVLGWLMRGARCILRALMFFGNLISACLLRQMEFNADAHMARVVGSETFAATMARLPELNAGARRAWELVNEFARINKLPADVNALIAGMAARPPGGAASASLAMEQAGCARGRLATHPPPAERIAAARRLAEPGIFHNTASAATLFTDAGALGREATLHHYAILSGVDMAKITLVENTEAAQRDQARAAGQNAAAALFEDLPLTELDLAPRLDDRASAAADTTNNSADAGAIAQELRAARAALAAALAAARPAITRHARAREAWRAQLTANLLRAAGFAAAARQIPGAAAPHPFSDEEKPEVCGAPSGRGFPHDEYPGSRGLDPGLTCGTPLACKPLPSPPSGHAAPGPGETAGGIAELERRAAELAAATGALQPCAAAAAAFINAAAARRVQETAGIQDAAARTKARENVRARLKIFATLCACAPDIRRMEETALAMPVLLRALSGQSEKMSREQLNAATLASEIGVDAGNRCAEALGKIACPFEEMPEGSVMSAYLLMSGDSAAHKLANNTRLVGHLYARMAEAAERIAGWLAATEAGQGGEGGAGQGRL